MTWMVVLLFNGGELLEYPLYMQDPHLSLKHTIVSAKINRSLHIQLLEVDL